MTKRRVLSVVAVLVLCVTCATAAVLYERHKNSVTKKTQNDTLSKQHDTKINADKDLSIAGTTDINVKAALLTNRSNDFLSSKDYDSAVGAAQAAFDAKVTDRNVHLNAALALATAYAAQGKFSEATATIKSLDGVLDATKDQKFISYTKQLLAAYAQKKTKVDTPATSSAMGQ